MKKSMKAALLSTFAFPGAGHFFLKKYIVGIVLLGVTSASLYIIISKTVERVLQITDNIQSGEVPIDIEAIMELVTKTGTTETQFLNIASSVIIISWIIGIVDSYRIGSIKDKNK